MGEVHLINPMLNAAGGSEWRAIRLFEKLAELADVTLWSYERPSPDLLGNGPPGEVHLSPIDLYKHHPDEPAFYRRLAAEGIRVRVMGGLSLAPALGDIEGIELFPANAKPPETFLASLDAFYFRTHPDWFEPSARVVSEAMASGLPVVAETRHGYVDYFAGGVLFDTPDEAFKALLSLRDDKDLRRKMAAEGRAKAEEYFGEEATRRLLEAYLR